MKCQHCGKELNQGVKFCDRCGTPVAGNMTFVQQAGPANGQNNSQIPQPFNQPNQINKIKKPIYKKWWFWVIICVAVVFVYIIGITNKKTDSEYSNDTTTMAVQAYETTAEPTTEEPTTEEPTTEEPTTQKPTEDPAQVEKKFKESCETIDFETLSRNPDKYKGNNYKFTGEVIQVVESTWGDTVDLRINVTKEEFEYIDDVMWTDTIYATVEIPEGEDRILEDDIITIYGTCDGMYTYESVLGGSISLPKISIKYYSLVE